MSFRTTSKAWQWTLWLCAGLAALAVYVVVSRLVFGSVGWAVFEPHRQRLALPLVVLFWLFAWETRWDGIRREEGTGKREQGGGAKSKGEAVEGNLTAGAASPPDGAFGERALPAGRRNEKGGRRPSTSAVDSSSRCQPQPQTQPSAATSSLSGEELYAQARGMQHRLIPDFNRDGPYLDLLGASAAKGYAPALAKLGEYAMRRAAWVEAYYWMKQAQRNGMHGLSPTVREIRKNWSQDGFPEQSSNVNQLFTREAGSIGRALLHVDSGREAAKAREYLKAHHPEFIPDTLQTT